MKNEGLRNTRETSMAKCFAANALNEIFNQAIRMHGAHGYRDEYDVERNIRDARGAMTYGGTKQIHQLVQAGYALGYRHDAPLRCELPAYNEQVWQQQIISMRNCV